VVRAAAAAAACLLLAQCASSDKFARSVDPRYGVPSSPRVVDAGEPVPKGGGVYRIGKPYVVAGRTYVPEDGPGYRAEGLASWYGDNFHGRQTANGEVFDMHSISAAHPTLPMPSYVRVSNVSNGRSLIVRINDRGPYHGNRIIDVSHKAADLLGFQGNGVARVRVEYVGPASLDGSDDRLLMATLRHGHPAPAPSSNILLAATKPFVPAVAAIGAAIPLPIARPFTLGDPQAAAEPRADGRLTDLSTGRRANRVDLARLPPAITADERERVAAMSAFAPASTDPPRAIVTGRGLY
jgi:rare lipoprotein A